MLPERAAYWSTEYAGLKIRVSGRLIDSESEWTLGSSTEAGNKETIC